MNEKNKRLKDRLPSQLISWLGILGGALTIVSNLEGVLTLSNWAHVVISGWSGWMERVWSALLGPFGVGVPSAFVLAWWTVSLFLLAIAVGARLSGGRSGSVHKLLQFSLSRVDVELLVLVLILVGVLVIPTNPNRTGALMVVLLTGLPYAIAVTLSQIISDTQDFVKRLRLVVGVVLLALALNWVSMLVARLS